MARPKFTTKIPKASASVNVGGGVSAYEAANTSGARSGFVAFPSNSRQEVSPYARREIVRKSRAAEANIPALTRIIDKFARHAVGSGINFRVLTDDEGFNSDCQRHVEEWWNNALTYSIDGSVDGWNAKLMAAKSIMLDGEYNAAFVKTASGWPMLQPLDVFEIETPGSLAYSEQSAQWDDGVRISEFERPIAYAVKSLPRYGAKDQKHVEIDAVHFLHMGKRRRARGHRFLPWVYSGLNKGIDALDLGSLITGTAKLHSALAVQVKRTAKRGQKGAVGAISKLGADEVATDTAALEKVYGSMINYVGENGEIDLKSSNHPGSDLVAFYKLLLSELAIGFDCSPAVMLSIGDVNGTEYRGQMEDAQSACDMLTDQITWQFVRREVIWKISNGIKAGRIRKPVDPYWFSKLVFRGPKKLTVDIGRMANAFKTLTRNCGLSTPRWFEEQGLDGDQEMDDQIRFMRRVMQKCEAAGVPVEWLFEPTPGTQMNNNQTPEA